MLEIIIVILVFVIYFVILFLMHKKGLFKTERFSLFGPFLMIKTQRGKKFIDKLAKVKRFWKHFGTLSIVICLLVMVSITIMLVWSAFLVPQIPSEAALSPEMILGIPGLNPLIPLWYGIIALIIAIVLHEFSHGILTRVANLKLKSLGLLFFVIPIGAFVEPDEEALKKTEKKHRMRVFAAGPAVNIIFALVFALIFSWGFMGSVVPKHDGVVVYSSLKDIPNEDAGLTVWAEITQIDGISIRNLADFDAYEPPRANATINVTVFYHGSFRTIENAVSGVYITSVGKDLPAYDAGIRPKMIIAAINGTEIRSDYNLTYALSLTHAGQQVNITLYEYNSVLDYYLEFNTSATLIDKYEYYQSHVPDLNKEEYRGKGFLGINSAYLGVSVVDVHTIPNKLAHPFSGVESAGDFFGAAVYYVSLPFPQIGLSPLQSPLTDLYETSGPLGVLPDSVFWPLANVFYWLFWINLMLGATNCLPAIPLDGGYVFKDTVDGIIRKIKKDMPNEKRERLASNISVGFAIFILFLIIWTLIGPYF